MYLKKIELKGFKSFPYKTTIEFNGGITSVVGPNGSGKSNISDAVRWVLGEQRMKSLRGEKLEDVIFGGTQEKKAMSYCEVSLTIDNQDKIMDIDFSEVTVKRRAYKSGESQFYINNEQCRLKDIKELFLDTGIGKEGYSIIEQGKIDEILSSNSASRRRIFDEASGISKYRYKKEEAQKKLKKTSENLERIDDIFFEIEKQISPLEKQMKKAVKYKTLSKELKTLEVNSFINQIETMKTRLFDLFESEKKLIGQMEAIKGKKENDCNELEKLKKLCEEISQMHQKLQREEFETMEHLERKKSEIGILKEKESGILSSIKRNDSEAKSLEESAAKSKSDLEKIMAAINEYSQKIDVLGEKRKSIESQIKSHNETIEKAETEMEDLKDGIVDIVDEKNKKLLKISSLEASVEAMGERKSAIEAEISDVDIAKDKKGETLRGIEAEIKSATGDVNEISSFKKSLNAEMAKHAEDIETSVGEINRINLDIKGNSSKLKIYESMERQLEGFNRGVKEVLRSGIAGVQDVVANILNVEKTYEVAIETALGGAIQNIITSNEYAAKKAIEHLKKNNFGRATFLPLNVFSEKSFKKPVFKMEEGIVGVASDIVKCSGEYNCIRESLLGRVIVVRDMDCAIKTGRQTGHKYKIVTLDGQVLNPGGSLTGGSLRKNSDGILSRGRIIQELSQTLQKLNEELECNVKREAELKIKMEEKRVQFEQHEKRMKEQEKSIMLLQNKALNAASGIEELDEKKARLEREKGSIQDNISNIQVMSKKLGQEIEALESQIEKSQKRLKELSSCSKDSATNTKEYEASLNEVVIEMTRLQSERSNSMREKERMDGEIERYSTLITQRKSESMSFENEIKKIKDHSAQLIAQVEKDQGMLEKMKSENSKLAVQKEEADVKREAVEKAMNSYENEYMAQREQQLNARTKIQEIESKKENILEKMLDLYMLTYEDALEIKDENLNIGQQEIKKLKAAIREIGNVNLDSIEEYTNVKERYDFYKEQKQDLENSVDNLTGIIKNMESSMVSEFKEKFETINERFKEVFCELFGGGSANLKLLDPADMLHSDIEIVAKPPGKNLKNINLMSGGEKSLTAIAVIFAILITRPTPFCILDEIEAALDDSNIYRFGEFLKRLSDKTQFIAITHRMGTMEASDYIYGVTMEESGISNILTLKLEDVKDFEGEEKIS